MGDKKKLEANYVGRTLADVPVAQLGADGTLIIGQGAEPSRRIVQLAPKETRELYDFLHEHFTRKVDIDSLLARANEKPEPSRLEEIGLDFARLEATRPDRRGPELTWDNALEKSNEDIDRMIEKGPPTDDEWPK